MMFLRTFLRNEAEHEHGEPVGGDCFFMVEARLVNSRFARYWFVCTDRCIRLIVVAHFEIMKFPAVAVVDLLENDDDDDDDDDDGGGNDQGRVVGEERLCGEGHEANDYSCLEEA